MDDGQICCNVPVFNCPFCGPVHCFSYPYLENSFSVLPSMPTPDPMGLPAPKSECWSWRWMAAKYVAMYSCSIALSVAPSTVSPVLLLTIQSILPLMSTPDPMGLPASKSECWNWRWVAAKYVAMYSSSIALSATPSAFFLVITLTVVSPPFLLISTKADAYQLPPYQRL